MKSHLDEANCRQAENFKIHIVTRAFPIENTMGSHSYLLSLAVYLKQLGFQVSLLLLDPSPGGNIPVFVIPGLARELFRVSARDNIQLCHLLLRFKSLQDWLVSPIWTAYYLLAEALHDMSFTAWHDPMKRIHQILRQFITVGNSRVRPWDALTTSDEIEFCRNAFVSDKPDIVIANYAFLADVFSAIPPDKPVLRVIITHDVRHQRVKEFARKKIPLLGESEWDLKTESEQLQKAQLLLAIQKEDANVFRKVSPGCEVLLMPMPATCQSCASEQIPARCLFVGSYANHNLHALNWLLQNVWPLVLRLVPCASLHVCGTVCETIKTAAPNVSFSGRVDDLGAEYGAAEVCLLPLVVGSGLKIKLVEALSYGRACVSTPAGVQGVREITNKAVMVAESAEDFAKAVQRILIKPDKRRQMEEQAHKFVRERFSPQVVYQPIIDRIYRHMGRSKGE